ncbi:MAG: hypothetical protein IJA20_08655 [Methanocorpusculum sp.]|nr:hypothetical protein [Oscillospiraceae bacterium]MBQ3570724.1 hypothetical protein [Methanocorpusculum sp.]
MRFVIPVKEFKNMTLQAKSKEPQSIKRCCCYAAVSNLPDHLRDYILPQASECALDEEQVTSWMDLSPARLHLYASPIVIHTDNFVFDNRNGKVTFELSDPNTHGIILGGTVLSALLRHRKPYSSNTPDGEMYIELEFLTGLSREQISSFVAFRSL